MLIFYNFLKKSTRDMNLLFVVVALLFGMPGTAQQAPCYLNYGFDFSGYNDSCQRRDFSLALQWTHPDSLRRKASLLNRVFRYDSLSEIGRQAFYLLDQMQRQETETFTAAFRGKWTWVWSGTNWGTDDSPKDCACTREIEITADSIIYRQDGRETRREPYRLYRTFWNIGSRRFLIEIPEKSCWIVEFGSGPDAWQTNIDTRGRPARFLNTSWGLGCACGCGQDIYLRFE